MITGLKIIPHPGSQPVCVNVVIELRDDILLTAHTVCHLFTFCPPSDVFQYLVCMKSFSTEKWVD